MLVPWWLFEKCPVCFQQYIMEHCRAKHVCSGKSSWKSSDVPLRFHGDFILKYLRVQKCKVYLRSMCMFIQMTRNAGSKNLASQLYIIVYPTIYKV